MKATHLVFLLMLTLAALGANNVSLSSNYSERHYADFLTNVTFRLQHADDFADSLDSLRKSKNFDPDAMAQVLTSIAEGGMTSTNTEKRRMAEASISAMGCLHLTNMLPVLSDWALRGGVLCLSSFFAYGEICDNDKRYLDLGIECVNRKIFSMDYLITQLCSILSADKQQRLEVPLDESTRIRMQKTIFDSAFEIPDSRGERDSYFCQLIPGYSNSQERAVILKRILDNIDTIPRPREGVRQLYLFPYDNKVYEYDDLTNKVRTLYEGELERIERLPMVNPVSVAEIVHTKSVPENERLNMTAILDAKIAAIEAAEARIARRELWKRRLRIGALVLPIPVIAIAVIFARRRMTR